MKMDIVIPTKGRDAQLGRLLETIDENMITSIDKVAIYFDRPGDIVRFTPPKLRKCTMNRLDYRVIPRRPYKAPDLWNHHMGGMFADTMLTLSDDTELEKGALRAAVNEYLMLWPNEYQGVLGLTQRNLEGKFDTAPAAFSIVGKGFQRHFINGLIWCPDYHFLYIDRELEMAARFHGVFQFSTTAGLIHHHPCTGVPEDDTYRGIRKWKAADQEMWRRRSTEGLIWGRDDVLLGREG